MKKILKRSVCIMLALLLFVTGIDVTGWGYAYAAAESTRGGTEVGAAPDALLSSGEWLYWVEDGLAFVAGYTNYQENTLKIPYSLGGYPVVGVGHQAFSPNAALDTISMHTNVTLIAEDAFEGLSGVRIEAFHGAYALDYAAEMGMEGKSLSTAAEFAKNVIDMSGLNPKAYENVTEESVVFKEKEATFLAVGQIIYFPATKKFQSGLARKVTSISASGGKLYASLARIELGEVFVSVSGEADLYLDWDNAVYPDWIVDEETVSSEAFEDKYYDGSVNNMRYNKELTVKVPLGKSKENKEDKKAEWSLEGKATFNVTANASYSIHQTAPLRWKLEAARVEATVKTSFTGALKVKGELPGHTERFVNPTGKYKKTTEISVPFFSAYGFNGYITIDFIVEVSGKLEVTYTETTVHVYELKNKKWNHNRYNQGEPTLEATAEGSIKIGPEVGIDISFGIAKVGEFVLFDFSVGLYVEGTGYAKLTSLTGHAHYMLCCDITVGLYLEFKVKVGITKIKLGGVSFESGACLTLPSGDKGKIKLAGPWNWHWDKVITYQTNKVPFTGLTKVKKCGLTERRVIYQPNNGAGELVLYSDVNGVINQPSVTPGRAGYRFEGWYVNTQYSGLPGGDYKMNFYSETMPYLFPDYSLYMYAKWKDLYPVTSITLNKSSITGWSDVGATDRLYTTSILPPNANNKTVHWTSTNPDVASVDGSGNVWLKKAGNATIICYSDNDSSVRATCEVTVQQSVTGIQLNTGNIFRYSDNMAPVQLTATALPATAVDKSVVWSSSNPAVAEVSSTGLVTLKSLGEATITCRSVNNPSVAASCSVAVRQAVTGIELDRESHLRTNADMSDLRPYAEVMPANAYNKALQWESTNPAVASVNAAGVVSMHGLGKATIICRSVSNPGITDSFEIEIIQAVTGISLNETAVTRYSDYKEVIQLTETVKPDDAGNKAVTWETTDKRVVTVSETGEVKVVAAGTADVVCRSVSNPDVTAACRFTILQAVTDITLNHPEISATSDEINVFYLIPQVGPENAANKAVTWKSSNPGVAEVTGDGAVTIRGVGEAVITCTSVSTPYITAECAVEVVQAVTGMRLNENHIYRYSGQKDSVQLVATLTAAEVANREVTWASSNPAVAEVSASGIVTVKGVGEAVITCASVSNPDVSAKCAVTVRQSVTDVRLNETECVRYSDETQPIQLTATVLPADAANESLVWESSDTAVAAVSDSGKVTITGAGQAVITCRSISDPDISASCAVTVRQAVQSLCLNAEKITRYTNETGTLQLEAYVRPSYAYDKSVEWTSSSDSVATVSDSGEVTVRGVGEAVITCTSVSKPEISAQCVITVKQAVESVELDRTEIEITNSVQSVQLTASVKPERAENTELAWTSSNPAVAEVSGSGLVTVTGCGTAVITCSAVSNPDAKASCTVTVKQAVLSVALNEQEIVLYSDDAEGVQLTASVQPAHAPDKSLIWESSNRAVAEVSADGRVTARGVGEAVISCISASNPEVAAQLNVTVKQAMTGIALDQTSIEICSDDAEGVQLTASVEPSDEEDEGVIWQTSNPDVAIVSDSGLVIAVGQGAADIYCRSARQPDTVFAVCAVKVLQKVESIRVEGDASSLMPGETLTLSAQCFPEYADDKTVVWSSDNAAVAEVDQSGRVTAKSRGNAVITARANDGSGVSASYAVKVESELTLNAVVENDTVYAQGTGSVTLASVSIGSASVRRMAEAGVEPVWSLVKPDDRDDVTMETIATTVTERGQEYETTYVLLHGSEFRAAGERTYTITCKAGEHQESAEIVVFVDGTAYAEKAMLSPSTFTVAAGEETRLPDAPVSADGGSIPAGIVLESVVGDALFHEFGEVILSQNGTKVRFDKSGVYTALLRYRDRNISYEVNASFFVQDENGVVRIPVKSVGVSQVQANMAQGESLTLRASVLPKDAYDASVVWTSTDETVVKVDQNGLVTAVAPGKAAIVCTAADGFGASAMCAVTVESFLQLDDAALDFTVYTGGSSHAELGIVNVTRESEKRLVAAGLNVTWKIEKISGEACEIALEEFRAQDEEGVTVSGNRIRLMRMNGAGDDEYRLTCKAGDYTAECMVRIHVAEADLPESIALGRTEYEGSVGEVIAIDTSFTGGELPEGTLMTIEGGRAFEHALSPEYNFIEAEQLIFSTPGTFTADVVFTGSNFRYVCPVTVAVRDAEGQLPVNITGVSIEPDHLYLMVGDQTELSAVIEPAEAKCGQVTWSSSDTSVASVSASGRVTAIGAGYAYISASVPEADFVGGCFVEVEDGLTLRETEIERTVFVDGITRIRLDEAQLTSAAGRRLDKAPEWSLKRVSGNNLTLRAEGYSTVDSDGYPVYGCEIILYSMSRTGTTEYELTCAAGDEKITLPVTVHAVSRDKNIPAALSLKENVFTAGVNELITIVPEIVCLPEGTAAPDGLRAELEGGELFAAARNEEDFSVSQNMTTVSFSRAGLFTANFVYSYSNMRYVIPVTFRIEDESGHVPVLSASMTLSSRSVWLVAGESEALSAVFTPADAENRAVTWTSTDETVAVVDQNGRVTAVGQGEAYIICTPEDELLARQACSVWVEKELTIESAADRISLYRQGAQKNEVFSANLTEGTVQRLKKLGVTPEWTITRLSGGSSEVKLSASAEGDSVIVTSVELKAAGEDAYRVTCRAGEYTESCDFTMEVIDLGTVPESVSAAQARVEAGVGETIVIDFTPVCFPAGSELPENDAMWSMYAGIGSGYQEAIDYSAYAENGDQLTVRFTKPGRYLISRQFFLGNLHYAQIAEVVVSQTEAPLGLLKADTTEAIVYMGGMSGTVAEISLADAIMRDVYGDQMEWTLERLSGSSLTAALRDTENGVTLRAVNALSEGEDVWRVTCRFGEHSESVDVSVSVRRPRSAVPEEVTLSADRISGMTGDWLNLPIAVKCWPEDAALPETGDDFWTFRPVGMAEDACSWVIEDGILSVRFLQSGYYTGMLQYEAGNFRYSLPVYMSITDEEGVLPAPQMEMHIVNPADTVYENGLTGVIIATAQVSRGAGSYYAGETDAYMAANQGVWRLRVTSGTAAKLSLTSDGNNARSIVLTHITETGSVTYEVSCTVDGVTYTAGGRLNVVDESEGRPDPVLSSTVHNTKPGEPLVIPKSVQDRLTSSVLQGETQWNPGALLPAIGYEYTETKDQLEMTFYQEGVYYTSLRLTIGNLVYDVPFTIVVSADPEAAGPVMRLPAALETIGAQAFMGSSAGIIDLRGTRVGRIEEGAFRNCGNLRIIYIPESVKAIAPDAFDGCGNVTIVCARGSAADTYAGETGISVRYE